MENNFIEVLDAKLSQYKDEVKKEVSAIDAKTAEIVSDLNAKAQKNGESLVELKEKVDSVIKSQGAIKAKAESDIFANPGSMIVKEMNEIISENIQKIADFGNNGVPFHATKTVGNMTMGANLTGTSQISYIYNPIMRSFYNPRLFEIFGVIPTATGNVTFPRATSGIGEGSFGSQTEGSAKAQVDYDVTMVNATLPFIAGYSKVSRQMLQDLPFLSAYLQTSLIEDWNRAVNTRYLNAIASSGTAGSTSASVTAEKIVDYVAQHGALGLGQANLILTTHAVWASILKTLPTNAAYSVPGGITIGASGETRIMGIPVVPHSQCTASKVYVLNTDAFKTAQASGLNIRSTETDQDDFIKNLVTYRCEARIDLISFQPTAAVYGAS